jgi:6-phospho-beta-glucosidase
MIAKLTLIGGSSINTPEIFSCLAHRGLVVDEVCLVARSADKLETVQRFCRRLCDELGLRTQVSATTELREGLQGAEYVINQVKVGGTGVWHRCQHILRSFGIAGHALNHGGLISNLHIVLGYARAVLEVCPDAWMVEFTNPCGMQAEAFAEHAPGLKLVTGCNVPLNARRQTAQLFGQTLDPTEVGGVEIAWFGFNHCAWIGDVAEAGASRMPEALTLNAASPQPVWNVPIAAQFGVFAVSDAAALFQKPAAPDLDAAATAARGFTDATPGREREALVHFADSSLRPTEALSRKRRANWYDSCLIPILEGLAGTTPRRYFCSLPTAAALPDMPGRTVEVAAELCHGELRPAFSLAPLSPPLKALASLLRASEILAIEAALHGSRSKAIESLAIHPACPSLQHAQHAVDFLIREVGLDLH